MKASYNDRKTLESGSTESPYLQIAKKLYEKTGCRENEGSMEGKKMIKKTSFTYTENYGCGPWGSYIEKGTVIEGGDGYRVFDLIPCDSHVSFYGKARVIENRHGGAELVSYFTTVCGIDRNGNFFRLWDGWSATTARHINSFRALYNLHPISKKEWESMPVVSDIDFVNCLDVEAALA